MVRCATIVQVQLPVLGQMIFEAYVPLSCKHFHLAVIRLLGQLYFKESFVKQELSLESVLVSNMSSFSEFEFAAEALRSSDTEQGQRAFATMRLPYHWDAVVAHLWPWQGREETRRRGFQFRDLCEAHCA